jgi:hypothetical protein
MLYFFRLNSFARRFNLSAKQADDLKRLCLDYHAAFKDDEEAARKIISQIREKTGCKKDDITIARQALIVAARIMKGQC